MRINFNMSGFQKDKCNFTCINKKIFPNLLSFTKILPLNLHRSDPQPYSFNTASKFEPNILKKDSEKQMQKLQQILSAD